MVKLIKTIITLSGCLFLGLTLEQEYSITDEHGVVIPKQLVYANMGTVIKIRRTDGFVYTGRITEIEEIDGAFKVYGQIDNVEETFFGFSIVKGGIFAGAIVEKASNKTYVLEFSLEHKGYIFLRTLKYDKTFA